MRVLSLIICAILLFAATALAQVPLNTAVQILKAEDARRYDAVLEKLMRSPNAAIRSRAALAAGRIGDDKAVPVLADLMENDKSVDVRAMAAFALGRGRVDRCRRCYIEGTERCRNTGHRAGPSC